MLRLYEEAFPHPGDVVVAQVARISEQGAAAVRLLEYGGAEGVILAGGSRPIGRVLAARVLRVDRSAGRAELSRHGMLAKEEAAALGRWECAARLQRAICAAAEAEGLDPEAVYRRVLWPLARECGGDHLEALRRLSRHRPSPTAAGEEAFLARWATGPVGRAILCA